MPKGLRGRAVVILLFPVIMIQLVVAAVFIQKHHDLVTRQMVSNVEPQIRLVLARINSASDIEDAIDRITPITVPGNLQVTIHADTLDEQTDKRLFYDFSGKIVVDTLKESVQSIRSIDLLSNDGKSVRILAGTPLGQTEIVLSRLSVSPSNPHQLLVLMFVTGIVLTALAYAFLRNQLKPIIRLAAASKAFGRGQTIQINESGATEVREATRAFLDMRKRIESHIQQRTQMLSDISHDLKTPLTRLRTGLELLDETPDTKELINDVKLMTSMVQEFVDFSKDAKREDFCVICIGQLIDAIRRDSQLPRNVLNIVVDNTIQADREAEIRPLAIRRAVQNLVQNAYKFADETKLTISAADQALIFCVEDNGPGIPEDKFDEALRPFARLDPSRNLSQADGVGLGLAITEDIANRHGGSLQLGSSQELGGLRATLTISVSKPPSENERWEELVGPEGFEPPTKAL